MISLKKSLYVTSYGAFISKRKNRLVIRGRDYEEEFVTDYLEELIIMGRGKSISSDAIELCIREKVPIFLTSSRGYPYAAIFPMIITGTVKRRREQYKAYLTELGIELAKKFVIGKLSNQMNLIRFWAKSRGRSDPITAKLMRKSANIIGEIINEVNRIRGERITYEIRASLMSFEARAAEIYWIWFGRTLSSFVFFPGRVKRGAKDPVNALLNLGYSILLRRVFTAILFAGLDPYAGFLHSDRSGRPSLALDLMEEFRQQFVDRVVIKMFTKRVLRPDDCIGEDGKLKDHVLKRAIEEFRKRLDEEVTNVYGEKRSLAHHISHQARLLSRVLVGDADEYKPFVLYW